MSPTLTAERSTEATERDFMRMAREAWQRATQPGFFGSVGVELISQNGKVHTLRETGDRTHKIR